MADMLVGVRGSEGEHGFKRLLDMEDGTHAEVVWTEPNEVELVTSRDSPVYAKDVWTPDIASDEALNDSDKAIEVATGEVWHILWVWVELTTTATQGDRRIVVEFQDPEDDVIGQVRAGVVQPEDTTYYYMFAPSLADLTAVRDDDYLMTPLPPTMILEAGAQVRIYDNNAVAAAADDMAVQMGYAYRLT